MEDSFWTVIVPFWIEGKTLKVPHVKAETKEDAERQVRSWYRATHNSDTDLPCEVNKEE